MHAIVCVFGTMGNVLPYLGWAHSLRARGHKVTLVGLASLESLPPCQGFPFVPVDPLLPHQADRAKGRPPETWSLLRQLASESDTRMRRLTEELLPLVAKPDVVVAAPVWAVGARLACELTATPLVTVCLQPQMLPRNAEFTGWSRPLLRPPYQLLVRTIAALVNRAMAPSLNHYRAEIGLPAVRRPMEWSVSPDAVFAFFPDWFAARQPAWPSQLKHVGFPLFDTWSSDWRRDELETFLAEGDRPLVFTQSSIARGNADFFRVSIEVAKRMNRRAILLTTKPDSLPHPLPAQVGYFGIVPLSAFLNRTAAFVHHGGMGTISQALAAGVPQLTLPRHMDQPDNCRWLSTLGVSRQLRVSQYRVDRVETELKFLLESREIAQQCRVWADRIPTQDPFGVACAELEALAVRRAGGEAVRNG